MYFDRPTISMHFRHGDLNIQDFHPILPFMYYKNTLRKIVEESGEKSIVYCILRKAKLKRVADYIRFIKRFSKMRFVKFGSRGLATNVVDVWMRSQYYCQ